VKRGIFAFITVLFLLFSSLPVSVSADESTTVWQDESVYLIMIDRFVNGDNSNDQNVDVNDLKSYQGGDFQGIIDQLDYIDEMGFTTILLTPIFDNVSGGYHGYWVDDYYQTEEHFGSIETFKKLIAEAHKRDIKVMIDFVISHTGANSSIAKDSEKKDWFLSESAGTTDDNVLYFNQENPEVKDYLIDAAKWWMEETKIDGYQLSSFSSVSNPFLTDFSKEVKAINNEFLLLGDFISEKEAPSSYKDSGIDGFVDYSFQKELRKVFPQPNQSFSSLLDIQDKREEAVLNPYLMANVIDNQHTIRYTRDMIEINEHPGPRWKQALTYIFTTPGIPIMFYGSEIALDGGKAPDNHKMMNFRTDKELVEYITKITEIRSKLPSLTMGTMDILFERDGFVVFKRSSGDETTVTAINNTTETQAVVIKADELQANKELRGILNGDLVRSKNDEYTITIDRDESEIYVLSNQSSINFSYFIAIGAVLIAFFVFLFFVKKRSRA
jgi:alpha-amylase